MGHPASEPPFDEGEPEAIPRPKGRPDGTQPDWLVGADEGMNAEAQENRPSMPRLTLTPGGILRPPAPTPPPAGSNLPPPPSPLRVVQGGGSPGGARSEPPSDVRSDVRSRAFSSSGKSMDESLYNWQKPNSEGEESAPEPTDPTDVDATVMVPPKKSRAEDAPSVTVISTRIRNLLGDDEEAPTRPKSDNGAWLRQLIGNRVVLIGLAVVIVGAGLWFYAWPKLKPGSSISSIRRNAAKLDGRVVTVRGRVGEVFPVGASYVFYLHQGRDTLVVFSSLRMPTPKEELLVTGKISTGYLDGVPRAALFEQAQ